MCFTQSPAWSHPEFRGRFLQALYLSADFTTRNLEKADINGNHYAADAAGLVFAGLFFGNAGEPAKWARTGWGILCDELPRQTHADGVDFEASVPYHRLATELFLLPALYRLKLGFDVSHTYRERLVAMARFIAAYSRGDGGVPLWGDADDARVLPFRAHPINDHRYLLAVVGVAFSEPSLLHDFSGPCSEPLWLLGPHWAAALAERRTPPGDMQRSRAFPNGGFYVLRNNRDHVFVDCGPLGTGGRGGHGHNDLLSFEATLDGVHLVCDCGAYLYTASMVERDNFRSTGYHNTPCIDGQEINRFVAPRSLWSLHNDADHKVYHLTLGERRDVLSLGHTGYERLIPPVAVRRTIELDHAAHALTVTDDLAGDGEHQVDVPLHLAIGVTARLLDEPGRAVLSSNEREFQVLWSNAEDWSVGISEARVSPSYGVVHATQCLTWRRHGSLTPLRVELRPI